MGHQMEHRRRPGAGSEGQEHITDLTNSGVGEDALDIALGHRRKTGHQQGGQADEGHQHLHRRRQFEQNMGASNQIDTCGHHGGGMDQGADRGRADHRIRQPGLQRQLCRFAYGATE